MQTAILFGSVAAALIIGWGTASGHGIKAESSSYVTSGGNAVVGSAGTCVRTGQWSEDAAIGVCEGEEEKVAEEVVAQIEETAPPPPPPPPPPVENVSSEKLVLSGRAMFGFDSSELTARGDSEMSELISKLQGYKSIERMYVVGHTDDRGPDEYNQWLSEQRAATVKEKLQGAFPDAEDTADGRRKNRRVELRIEAIK